MQGDLYFGIKFQVKTSTVLKLRFKIYSIRIFSAVIRLFCHVQLITQYNQW